jgi:formylglycine-generating enzyme required for sulfatase activity
MPITLQTNESKQLATFTVVGEVYFHELTEAVESFLKGQHVQNVLWDFRKAIPKGLFRMAEVSGITKAGKTCAEMRAGGKTALVASSNFAFGLISMYKAFAELQGHPQTVRAFRSMDQAITWLALEK